jgi:hypothetical protein
MEAQGSAKTLVGRVNWVGRYVMGREWSASPSEHGAALVPLLRGREPVDDGVRVGRPLRQRRQVPDQQRVVVLLWHVNLC